MSSIDERVKKIVVEQLSVSDAQCTNEASFITDLGANPEENDDLDELFMAFEEEFGVDFPEDSAERIKTVGEAIDYLKKAGAE